MQWYKLFFVYITMFAATINAQINYSGPATGFVDTGVVRTTDDFSIAPLTTNMKIRLIQHSKPELLPAPYGQLSALKEGSNFILDPNYNKISALDDSVIVFEEFEGFRQANSIPPDPYIAVGPEHIIITVNSNFKITDKQGNELKSISADNWYSNLISGVSTFDPKVIYDHYAGRWVMVWLHVNEANSESFYLVSVSDDSNPLGIWYSWAFPSNVNGMNQSGSWGDYEGVGFDDKAIYLTSNQFYFSGNYSNTKLRIILKDQLYSGTAGRVDFTDIWNIKYPNSTANAFGLRPTRMYTPDTSYYFVAHSPFNVGSNFGVYKLTGITTTPKLEGSLVAVTPYSMPPDADQLGGGTPRIDGGGFGLRNEPVYKNGKLHIVHSVRVTSGGAYSGVRYLAINTADNSVVTDFVMGAPQKYHTYPAVALDSKENVFITYSRSGKDQYAGAYFTIVPSGSSTPTGSFVMQEGRGNYVVTFGGARNRWGDYMGAWQDPSDSNSVWFYTEYVYSKDKWGTWASGVRFEPFEQAYIFSEIPSVDFGEVEVGTDTLHKQVIIRNFGQPSLVIDKVSVGRSDVFSLNISHALPAALNAFDTLIVNIDFLPSKAEYITDSLAITSNDPDDPVKYIPINAIGFEINAAQENILYASTAPLNVSGKLLTINEADGSGTEIGDLGFPGVISLTINPLNNNIYGLVKTLSDSKLLVINSLEGDAHIAAEFPIPFSAITFDNSGKLFGFTSDRNIYELTENGDTTHLSNLTKIPISAAVNPLDNQLWFFSRTGLNSGKLYKVNPYTGEEIEIASLDLYASDITFDASGDLFAVFGSNGKLAAIDTSSGVHYEVGAAGFLRVNGLAINGDITVTAIGENEIASDIPSEFKIEQNYPNPFNPSTTISFALPVNAEVTVSLFNILGQKIADIVNKNFSAGFHSVEFDASSLSSGTYLYRIKAKGVNGQSFIKTRKMVLLK